MKNLEQRAHVETAIHDALGHSHPSANVRLRTTPDQKKPLVLRKRGCYDEKYYRDAKHYRERAEECRVVAEILASVELRDKMLVIAADYERMAHTVVNLTHDEPDVCTLR